MHWAIYRINKRETQMLVPAPGDYSDTSFPHFPQTAYAWGFSFLRDPQIKTSIQFLFFFAKELKGHCSNLCSKHLHTHLTIPKYPYNSWRKFSNVIYSKIMSCTELIKLFLPFLPTRWDVLSRFRWFSYKFRIIIPSYCYHTDVGGSNEIRKWTL